MTRRPKDGYHSGFRNHCDDANDHGDDDDSRPSGLGGHTYEFTIRYLI